MNTLLGYRGYHGTPRCTFNYLTPSAPFVTAAELCLLGSSAPRAWLHAGGYCCAGFSLNDEGGIMKISPDEGLLQCATVADVRNFKFADGQV